MNRYHWCRGAVSNRVPTIQSYSPYGIHHGLKDTNQKKVYKLDSPKNIFDIVHGTVLKILRTQQKLQDTKGQPQKKHFSRGTDK